MDIKKAYTQFTEAEKARAKYDDELADASYYVLQECYGDKRFAKSDGYLDYDIMDSTAGDAVDKKVAELMAYMFPLSRPFLRLKRMENAGGVEREKLEQGEKKFHDAILESNFYSEVMIALKHAMIANGAIVFSRGTPANPFRFRSVPMASCYHVENEMGMLSKSFVVSKMSWRDIEDNFGVYVSDSDETNKLNRSVFDNGGGQFDSDKKHDVIECFELNKDGTTNFALFGKKDGAEKAVIFQQDNMIDIRFIAFRMGKVCASTIGRGPALKVLPLIRLVNKFMYLTMLNAERLLGGVVLADLSMISADVLQELATSQFIVLNVPSHSREPRMMQSNEHPFDSSVFALNEIRQEIEKQISGWGLPSPAQGNRRTAREFEIRRQERAVNTIPETELLQRELFRALVETGLNILQMGIMSDSPFALESFGVDDDGRTTYYYEAENSLVLASKQQLANAKVQAFTTTAQIFGAEVAHAMFDVPSMAMKIASLLGASDSDIYDAETMQANFERLAAMREAQMKRGENPAHNPNAEPLEAANAL